VSTPRKPDRRLTFWNIWLGWIAANAAFWALGFGLAQIYARALYADDSFIRQTLAGASYIWTRPLGSVIGATNYGLMLGTAIGLGQWIVLRRRFDIEWLWWLAATMLGFALHGLSLGLSAGVMGDQVTAAGLGLLCGGAVVVGIPQWLVLRQHLPHAGWWIVASAAGLLLAAPDRSGGTNSLMAWLFVSMGAGAAYGIVTAFFLFFMMPSRRLPEEDVKET
jgi:hypothetical protein